MPQRGYEDYFPPEQIPERYRVCSCCRYWLFNHKDKIVARVGGETVVVGQCTAADDSSNGPIVEEVYKGVHAVFTSDDGYCNAFVPSADAVEEWCESETDTTYRDLDIELKRDAWSRW